MKLTRFSETGIIKILKEHDAGRETTDICREHGIFRAILYTWKKKYGWMDASQLNKLAGLKEVSSFQPTLALF
jgi:putative transposase